jgi:hypothetical protein
MKSGALAAAHLLDSCGGSKRSAHSDFSAPSQKCIGTNMEFACMVFLVTNGVVHIGCGPARRHMVTTGQYSSPLYGNSCLSKIFFQPLYMNSKMSNTRAHQSQTVMSIKLFLALVEQTQGGRRLNTTTYGPSASR